MSTYLGPTWRNSSSWLQRSSSTRSVTAVVKLPAPLVHVDPAGSRSGRLTAEHDAGPHVAVPRVDVVPALLELSPRQHRAAAQHRRILEHEPVAFDGDHDGVVAVVPVVGPRRARRIRPGLDLDDDRI